MGDVNGAVDTVKDRLDQGIFDWDVSHGDLKDISETVSGLTPAERNELVGRLSDDDLKNWTQEIDGDLGSLSASEREDLFNKLAEGLDGNQLARLARAFDGSPTGLEALGKAITGHASPQAQSAFIAAVKGDIGSNDQVTELAAAALAGLGTSQADFDATVKTLSDGQLESLINAGLGHQEGTAYFVPFTAMAIIDAATRSGDLQAKAAVFEAASTQFNLMNGTMFEGAYMESVAKLIGSDPNGLVNELQSRSDLSGESLAEFSKWMLKTGQEDALRNLVVQMQQGNDGSGSAYERFSDPAYARNLGFMAGAIAAGINGLTDDKQGQADLLKNIFGAHFGAAGATDVGPGVVASVGNGITTAIIDQIVSDVADGGKDLKQAMYELAIPRNESAQVNMSGTGYDAFNAAYGAVAELNR